MSLRIQGGRQTAGAFRHALGILSVGNFILIDFVSIQVDSMQWSGVPVPGAILQHTAGVATHLKFASRDKHHFTHVQNRGRLGDDLVDVHR